MFSIVGSELMASACADIVEVEEDDYAIAHNLIMKVNLVLGVECDASGGWLVIGVNSSTMESVCGLATVRRLFLAAMGFVGEHQRFDRDDYLSVTNDSRAASDAFRKIEDSTPVGDYDHYSVFHSRETDIIGDVAMPYFKTDVASLPLSSKDKEALRFMFGTQPPRVEDGRVVCSARAAEEECVVNFKSKSVRTGTLVHPVAFARITWHVNDNVALAVNNTGF
ncbi:hypothetical protein DIPPA_01156 [Diplonema papillatum]|nr:hypothetical protein DIPPA_01156 [Diplonema papillatum]